MEHLTEHPTASKAASFGLFRKLFRCVYRSIRELCICRSLATEQWSRTRVTLEQSLSLPCSTGVFAVPSIVPSCRNGETLLKTYCWTLFTTLYCSLLLGTNTSVRGAIAAATHELNHASCRQSSTVLASRFSQCTHCSLNRRSNSCTESVFCAASASKAPST